MKVQIGFIHYLKKYTKADIYKECPLNYLSSINIPILFLNSEEEKFVQDDMKKRVFSFIINSFLYFCRCINEFIS